MAQPYHIQCSSQAACTGWWGGPTVAPLSLNTQNLTALGVTVNPYPFPHWCAIEVKGDLEVPAGTAWTNCAVPQRERGVLSPGESLSEVWSLDPHTPGLAEGRLFCVSISCVATW